MFKRIMVALDGSEPSMAALRVAMDLAVTLGAELHAVSVAQVPDYPATVGEVQEAHEEAAQRFKSVHDEVHRIAAPAGVEVVSHILVGHPAETLVTYARREKIDLIALGQRGLSNVQRFFLGSVSDRVAHHAPCTVMIVKESSA
ncbi:MAG: universal stress protein [Armatimonadetes bacterium]|nr:universal stress protein [Armatimonadota bacterium]